VGREDASSLDVRLGGLNLKIAGSQSVGAPAASIVQYSTFIPSFWTMRSAPHLRQAVLRMASGSGPGEDYLTLLPPTGRGPVPYSATWSPAERWQRDPGRRDTEGSALRTLPPLGGDSGKRRSARTLPELRRARTDPRERGGGDTGNARTALGAESYHEAPGLPMLAAH
jgi:hypothetical protein